jgi:cytochrome c oxidase subunit II
MITLRRPGLFLLVCACAHARAASFQDSLRPAGPQAAHIHQLWVVMLWTCTLVTAAILFALLIALLRAPRATERTPPDVGSLVHPELATRKAVTIAVGVSILLLLGLLFASVLADRALAQLPLQHAVKMREGFGSS